MIATQSFKKTGMLRFLIISLSLVLGGSFQIASASDIYEPDPLYDKVNEKLRKTEYVCDVMINVAKNSSSTIFVKNPKTPKKVLQDKVKADVISAASKLS